MSRQISNLHIGLIIFVYLLGLSNSVDIIFVVDVSKKMAVQEVENIKQFLQITIGDYHIKNDGVRVGILLMGFEGNNGRSILSLNDGSNREKVVKFVESISKQAGNSNLKAALDAISSTSSFNKRRGVSQVVYVLTKNDIESLKDAGIKEKLSELSKAPNKVVFVDLGDSLTGDDVNVPESIKFIPAGSTRKLPEVLSKIYKEAASARGNNKTRNNI